MKKITNILSALAAVLTLLLLPMTVHAQAPIDIGGPAATAPVSDTVGVPNTGIAPKGHVLTSNVAIFAGGSLLGAALGLGIVTIRKNKSDS